MADEILKRFKEVAYDYFLDLHLVLVQSLDPQWLRIHGCNFNWCLSKDCGVCIWSNDHLTGGVPFEEIVHHFLLRCGDSLLLVLMRLIRSSCRPGAQHVCGLHFHEDVEESHASYFLEVICVAHKLKDKQESHDQNEGRKGRRYRFSSRLGGTLPSSRAAGYLAPQVPAKRCGKIPENL